MKLPLPILAVLAVLLAACNEGPVSDYNHEIPFYPDAERIAVLHAGDSKFGEYMDPRDRDTIIAWYKEQMSEMGWKLIDEPESKVAYLAEWVKLKDEDGKRPGQIDRCKLRLVRPQQVDYCTMEWKAYYKEGILGKEH